MKRKTKVCDKCNREISLSNFDRHVCKNVERKVKDDWKVAQNSYKCPYCDKLYSKKGIGYHVWANHTEEGNIFRTRKKGKMSQEGRNNISIAIEKKWKEEEYQAKISSAMKGKLTGDKNPSKRSDVREKLSIIRSNNPTGGDKYVLYYDYVKKSGKKIKLHGTYEVRLAKYLDDNNYNWEYNKAISYLDSEGIKHRLLPDFYIPSLDKYLDTKGLLRKEWKEKLRLVKEQKQIIIHVIFKYDLDDIEKRRISIEDFENDIV